MRVLRRVRVNRDLRVGISLHAAKRWRERAYPELGVCAALDQLTTEVSLYGVFSTRPPAAFAPGSTMRDRLLTEGWLVLHAERLAAFPLINFGGELVATTCLVRGERQAA